MVLFFSFSKFIEVPKSLYIDSIPSNIFSHSQTIWNIISFLLSLMKYSLCGRVLQANCIISTFNDAPTTWKTVLRVRVRREIVDHFPTFWMHRTDSYLITRYDSVLTEYVIFDFTLARNLCFLSKTKCRLTFLLLGLIFL